MEQCLVEGIMGNVSVKLFFFSGSGGDVVYRYLLSTALAAILFGGTQHSKQFW